MAGAGKTPPGCWFGRNGSAEIGAVFRVFGRESEELHLNAICPTLAHLPNRDDPSIFLDRGTLRLYRSRVGWRICMRNVIFSMIGVLGIFLSSAVPASAQLFTGQVEVAGRRVPLPPGEWRQIGAATEQRTIQRGNMIVGSAILIQEINDRVAAMTIITDASTNPARPIDWSIPNICTRENTFSRSVNVALAQSQDCYIVNHIVTSHMPPNTISSLWEGYWTQISTRPGWIPNNWVEVAFRMADRTNSLTVSYRVNPEVIGGLPATSRGGRWEDSAFHRQNLDPARRAFMERMSAWAQRTRSIVSQCFGGWSCSPAPAF